jgi:hypothetical protein
MEASMRSDRRPPLGSQETTGSGGLAWVTGVLRSHGMPAEEIRALLSADDPTTVRRYLELHRERLDEWLADQVRVLAIVEDLLAATAHLRGRIRRTEGDHSRRSPCSMANIAAAARVEDPIFP